MSAALALTEFSPRLALPLAANDNDGQGIYTIYNRAGELVHVDDLTTGTKTDYVRLAGRTVARVEDKITPTYVHGDHLGSPVSRSNAAGTLLPRERYTPFGITLNNPSDLNNQAGFTGHIKDSATGLNYMQARYYDPIIGRFLSIDPVAFMDTGDTAQFNRYAYVQNDPINMIDPDVRESALALLKMQKANPMPPASPRAQAIAQGIGGLFPGAGVGQAIVDAGNGNFGAAAANAGSELPFAKIGKLKKLGDAIGSTGNASKSLEMRNKQKRRGNLQHMGQQVRGLQMRWQKVGSMFLCT